ncbi:MAG: hypothetical protein JSS11_11140 [Verrucomicrobia bacterium]|nr:hypothetical protein [Verrucomicrobiota bacterium]
MKNQLTTLLALLGLGTLLGLAAGCGTTDTLARRIEQHHDVYAGLSAEEKTQIDRGIITVGFSPEMVLMALGKPERVVPGRGPGAEDWIYVNLYSPNGDSVAMASKVSMQYPLKPHQDMGPPQYYKFDSQTRSPGGGGGSITDTVPVPTYQLVPDLANEQIKAESAIKVHVKFTEGTVEDIQIVSDGRG